METRQFTLSSYGILFQIDITANYFDPFLEKFIADEIENSENLYEEIEDNQSGGWMEGNLSGHIFTCFDQNDQPVDIVQKYQIKATYKALGFKICPWLQVIKIDSETEIAQKLAAWRQGQAGMHIASIDIHKDNGQSVSGADDIFFDRKSALRYFTTYFGSDEMPVAQNGYFVCSIRHFNPPIEERQEYLIPQDIFDLSDWSSTEPYYI